MEEIKPHYAVVFDGEFYGIFGKDETSGKQVLIKRVSYDKYSAEKIAAILNENAVSVLHAKDVIRDFLLAFVFE